jgi:hypothetical protein
VELTNEGADVVRQGLDDRADDHDRSTQENRDTTSKTVGQVGSDGGRSESADGLNAVEQTELLDVRDRGDCRIQGRNCAYAGKETAGPSVSSFKRLSEGVAH